LVPDDDGGYIDIDENGVPSGVWVIDDDTGKWVLIEYPPSTTENKYQPITYGTEPTYIYNPPGKTPPQTGDSAQTKLYVIMLCVASTAAMGSTGYLLTDKVRKGKGEEI